MRRLFGGGSAPVDWLVVGLGNPGERYARTRHNVGFEVANELARRWNLPRAKKRYAGLYTDGRTGPGGPRVAVLWPQTFMNEAGNSAGPARGALHLDLDRVLVLHDEIDLPFGEIRTRIGGGLAGHNGLKSLRRGLGSPDFARVTAAVRSSAEVVVLPSKAVITSPTFRPAFAAGEPATTCVILAPPATLWIRTPRYACCTVPPPMRVWATLFALLIGTAKPTPALSFESLSIWSLIPITVFVATSINGPPELPWLIAASV